MDNIKELTYEEIKTEHGVFSTHFEMGLTAQEYYEWWLNQLENPTPAPPTLEEVVEQQANKISILEQENANLTFILMNNNLI